MCSSKSSILITGVHFSLLELMIFGNKFFISSKTPFNHNLLNIKKFKFNEEHFESLNSLSKALPTIFANFKLIFNM